MAWNEPGGGNQHDPWSGGGRNGDKKGAGVTAVAMVGRPTSTKR